jgi:hypothetical protein
MVHSQDGERAAWEKSEKKGKESVFVAAVI